MTDSHRRKAPFDGSTRAADLGLWSWDPRSDEVTLSTRWMQQLGYEEGADAHDPPRTWDEFVHPADLLSLRDRLGACVARPGRGLEATVHVRHIDGSWRTVLLQADLVTDEAGASRLLGSHADVTALVRETEALREGVAELQRTEEVLRQSEARLQLALDAGRLGEWSWDMATGEVTWSAACKALYGIPPETEITYERFLAAVYPEDRARVDAALKRAVDTKADYDLEKRVVWPDGTVRWTVARGRVICDASGTPVKMVGVTMDVTERHRTETALRSLMDSSPGVMGTFYMRPDGTMCLPYVSERIRDLFGLSPDDVRDDAGPLLARTHPDDAERVYASIAESARTMTPSHKEYRVRHPTRGELWLEGHSIPQPHPEGGVIWYGFVHDITARKRAEADLRTREQEFRALAENLPDIVLRLDTEGRYVYANPALERLTGIRVSEVIGRRLGEPTATPLDTVAAPEEFLGLRAMLERVVETGAPAETDMTIPSSAGEQSFEVRAVPEFEDSGRVASVLAIGREVTARRRAEKALRASELRFRQVTENIDEVFWLTDLDKREMMYVSPAYARVWGRTCDSLYAEPGSWMDAIHAEDQERVREDARARQASGTYDVEYRVVRPDGTVRWVHDRAFPITNAEGRVYRIAGVAEDITTRRELEEQLRQSQKMEAIGHLAGGIAHDFNNLLVVIQLQSSHLLAEGGHTTETRNGIREIMGATERATNLTRQLLTFGRREVWRPRSLNLREVIGGMVNLLRRLLGEDVSLETAFAEALPPVYADTGMMEQVLMNLAINARDAMPGGGRLVIALDAAEMEAEDLVARPEAEPGPHVVLTVRDSGCGISTDALPHIFEPFFTTKETGRGTGLGLATVFGIVKQHRGWVDVTSKEGHGTTFEIALPAVAATPAAAGPETPTPEPPVVGGTETIMLVEDDRAVRRVARIVLERYGYRVVEAASAAEALEVWSNLSEPVDMLLTDLVMPGGISGADLAAQLTRLSSALKVVFTSGYSPEVVHRHLQLDHGFNFLQKPYSIADLARTVRRALDT